MSEKPVDRPVPPRTMAEASPDTLLVVDRNGSIVRVSGDTTGMLGTSRESLTGQSIATILSPESAQRFMARFEVAFEAGPGAPTVVLEGLKGIGRGEGMIAVEALVVVLESNDRYGETALVTIRDDRRSIGRREVEREMRERLESSNRDLEAFASVAAHDLQEPLRKIRAFSDRARTAAEAGDVTAMGKYLERVDAAAFRMQTLLDDLLVLARVSGQTSDRRPVDLTHMARAIADELVATVPEAVIVVGEIPVVNADPVRMRQLLTNLLGNAIKYRREGVEPRIEISSRSDGGWVEISVTDNGIGFDDVYREKIFRPFQRLHGRSEYEGTGIGLALCRAVAERHGGTLTGTGRPGEGATFTVMLPAEVR